MKPKRSAIVRHTDLLVYQRAFKAAMRIFDLTNTFPKEERFALIDQIRRSSRSVCANLAEAWRKRRYEAAFVAKFNDSEGEAAETQCWLQFAVESKYLPRDAGAELYKEYDELMSIVVDMINHASDWTLR